MKHLLTLILATILIGCASRVVTPTNFTGKYIYDKLKDESANGTKVDLAYDDGMIFAKNYFANTDSNNNLTVIVFTQDWASVGSEQGFSKAVSYTDTNWESKLFSGLQEYSRSDNIIACVAEINFDFRTLHGFISKMRENGYAGLILHDIKIEGSQAKLRPIEIKSVSRRKSDFTSINYPRQDFLNGMKPRRDLIDSSQYK